MAVLRPIKVTFTNFDDASVPKTREVADFPQKPEGESPMHTVNLTPTVYIDAADFRTEDDKECVGHPPPTQHLPPTLSPPSICHPLSHHSPSHHQVLRPGTGQVGRPPVWPVYQM